MSLWDSIRRLGEAGRRVVERIDALEEEVRNANPSAIARKAATEPSERILEGGVDDLHGFDGPAADEALDGDTLDPDSEDPEVTMVDLPVVGPDDPTIEARAAGAPDGEGEAVEFPDVGSDITDQLEEVDDTERPTGPLRLADEDTLVLEELPKDGPRFRNSLGFSDQEVVTLFRVEHYPHLPGVDDVTLYRLSRVEEDVLVRSMYVGHAFRDAWRRVVPADELWEAAFWFTGVHRDPQALESLQRLETDWTDEAARQLGWAVWRYCEELRGAVKGLEDPAALVGAFEALDGALKARERLIARSDPALKVELDHRPVELRGVFRFKGFRWLR